MANVNDIASIVDSWSDRVVAVRRKIHAQPELGFEEVETARTVASFLAELGVPFKEGIAKTGIVGFIDGAAPGRTIAIRADMDALPVLEATDLPFASTVPGKMHACGHDSHTAILLGVAAVLSQMRANFAGRVALVFQPAEEILGGARAMIEDGLLEELQARAFLGFHNLPSLATGSVGWHRTVTMASCDSFDVRIIGKSGHGAHPHLGIDPIVATCQFVDQVQTIISREIAPTTPAVLTFGRIMGGVARNIIAQSVELNATVRTLDIAVADQIEAAVKRVLEGLKLSMRVDYDLTWERNAPVVRNDPIILGVVLDALRGTFDNDKLIEMAAPSMGSEDYAWFSDSVPSAHLRLGSRIEGYPTMLHRENFTVNEDYMAVGVQAMTTAALGLLNADNI